MENFEFSSHARDMLAEREIPEEWIWRTIGNPDRTEIGDDGNRHYIKAIPEHGEMFLRVIVDPRKTPECIVTIFFDRRLGKRQCD